MQFHSHLIDLDCENGRLRENCNLKHVLISNNHVFVYVLTTSLNFWWCFCFVPIIAIVTFLMSLTLILFWRHTSLTRKLTFFALKYSINDNLNKFSILLWSMSCRSINESNEWNEKSFFHFRYLQASTENIARSSYQINSLNLKHRQLKLNR